MGVLAVPELSGSIPLSAEGYGTYELGMHLMVGPSGKKDDSLR